MRRLVIGAFVVTGATGLIYQVLWVRLLGFVFGNSTQAVAAVLCAFMGGLALGGWFFGRVADRHGRPLRLFALLEGAAAFYAMATPWLFGGLEALSVAAAQAWPGGAAGALVRFGGAALVIGLPTALLGGSLPCLARHFADRTGGARDVAVLYSANTWGGVAGVVLAIFFMIPLIGVRACLLTAAAANLLAAVLVYRLDARQGVQAPVAAVVPARQPARLAAAIMAAAVVNGFTALAYEVIWSRLLAMTLGSSVYSFAIILIAVLTGIALGSALFARAERSFPSLAEGAGSAGLVAGLHASMGVAVLLLIPVFGVLPWAFLKLFGWFGGRFAAFELAQFLLVLAVLLVPATLSGAVFPAAARWYAGRDGVKLAQGLGALYGANTLGAVCGSLLAGFALIPWLGLQGTMKLVALINLGLGIVMLSFSLRDRDRLRTALVTGLVFFAIPYVIAVPAWNRGVVAGGVYQYAPDILSGGYKLGSGDLLFYKEGPYFTVSVKKEGDLLSLGINGKADASTQRAGDMQTQMLSGHLPLLLKPGVKKVLVVGLASGITLGAVAAHGGVEQIDCVEIEPSMTEAAAFFEEWNGQALKDPRVRLIVEDGRQHLLTTRTRYDAIISVPSNPWISGSSALFTKDYFELARRRLAPGGVFAFWMQSYELPLADFKSVVRTALTVFPELTLWRPNPGDTLFIAGEETLRIDYPAFARRVAAVQDRLTVIGLPGPLDLLARFSMSREALDRFSAGAPLNTDDRPRLEFSAPKRLYEEGLGERNAAVLAAASESAGPLLDRFPFGGDLAERLLGLHLFAPAASEVSRSFAGARRELALGDIALRSGRPGDAAAAFRAAGPSFEPLIGLSRAEIRLGRFEEAHKAALAAAKLRPGSAAGHDQVGAVLMAQGKLREALKLFEKASKLDGSFVDAHLHAAQVYLALDIPPAALERLELAVALAPASAAVRHELGRAFYRLGLTDEAAVHFSRAMELDPAFRPIVAATLERMNR